ncbi:MAG: DUF4375 domain-containing protein [Verrucomicrobiota bacterium]
MRLPSARQLWRSTVRAVLNPGWKQRALRSRHLNQAITRFQHRAIHRDLTADTLGGISDDEILQAVYDCVETRLPQGHVGVLPTGTGIPGGCASIYYFRTMDYDVWNGGFDQFLDGADPDLTAHTVQALRFLGLAQMADTVVEAQQRFASGDSMSRCDARYAELQPAAEQHIIHFIRRRPDEFTTTNMG